DGRIRIFTSSFFQNDEFQVYLNAADVVVLPFVDVLTSGSAITAMSFGKPVILPRLGCLPELADDTMGVLYSPEDATGLERALVEVRRRDLKAAGRAAFARARALDWDGIAARVAEVYRQ
ncbi:glycosyltransferase, partial [bacterium]|nr:glycosyltransferase [bacterium]